MLFPDGHHTKLVHTSSHRGRLVSRSCNNTCKYDRKCPLVLLVLTWQRQFGNILFPLSNNSVIIPHSFDQISFSIPSNRPRWHQWNFKYFQRRFWRGLRSTFSLTFVKRARYTLPRNTEQSFNCSMVYGMTCTYSVPRTFVLWKSLLCVAQHSRIRWIHNQHET